jgi:hypothetical protein
LLLVAIFLRKAWLRATPEQLRATTPVQEIV